MLDETNVRMYSLKITTKTHFSILFPLSINIKYTAFNDIRKYRSGED